MSAQLTSAEKADEICNRHKREKRLRDVIADITAKLNRPNLSAGEGHELAKRLTEVYDVLNLLQQPQAEESTHATSTLAASLS